MVRSLLQSGILRALPDRHEQCIRVGEIFKRLGVASPTASQRASLSRSLKRLADNGLAQRYYPHLCLPGNGDLWTKA
jgi:DNA-binding MarR family transcriptional regulator